MLKAILATSSSRPGGKLSTASTRGSPIVRVPVLSIATVSISAEFLNGGTAADKIPRRAPLAMAARIALGMLSTDTGTGDDEQRHGAVEGGFLALQIIERRQME